MVETRIKVASTSLLQFTINLVATGIPKNNPNQQCSTKPGPNTTNITAYSLGTLAKESFIASMQKAAQKLHPSAATHQNFKQPQPP